MRNHIPTLSVAGITGIALLACGSGPLSSVRESRSEAVPNRHDPTLLHGRYTAPPDRALMAIAMRATAPDPGGAAAKIRANIDQLRTALADTPTCQLQVQDYAPPVSLDNDWTASTRWRANAWATLDADLTGLTDPLTRMDRLDACRSLILPHVAMEEAPSKAKPVAYGITLGAHTLIVDAPESHLAALIERRSANLTAVSTPGSAPQLHPEDYRCVPNGLVQVGTASLAGVVLTLGMECRVVTEAAVEEPTP